MQVARLLQEGCQDGIEDTFGSYGYGGEEFVTGAVRQYGYVLLGVREKRSVSLCFPDIGKSHTVECWEACAWGTSGVKHGSGLGCGAHTCSVVVLRPQIPNDCSVPPNG